MSVQAVAPHSVAINAINKISVRSCSALSARGSGNSEKHSANPFIGRSLQIRSSLQNPLSLLWQLLTEYHMRFPCLEGEGRLTWSQRVGAKRRPMINSAKCETGWGD